MKLILDENISYRLIKKIKPHFSEVISVNNIYPLGIADRSIWRYALENEFAILSFDSDFQDFAFLEGPSPKVILLRPGNLRTREIAHLIAAKISQIENFLSSEEEVCLVLEG